MRITRARVSLFRAAILGFFMGTASLVAVSAGQDAIPQREFSAHLLMRMGTEKSGVGAQIHVKQDNLYLDFPDLARHGRIPFWFLSNGVVASVKAATDEDFNPGPTNPLAAGLLLRFHATSPDHFCEEFRAYSIQTLRASEEGLTVDAVQRLQKSENFPCEQTGRKTVAGRDCVTYRAAAFILGLEDWMTMSFDPKLGTITEVQVNPPQGLILRLDSIKEEPQPSSLFVLPPEHVVMIELSKPAAAAPK